MNLLALIPLPYRISLLAALAAALVGLGYIRGASHVQAEWDAAKVAQLAAESKATAERLASNVILEAKHAADNAAITKAKDEELADVRARLAAAGRMRLPAFCQGSAATAETASTGSSSSPDPASGVLPDAVAERVQALILQTEEVAATGRACQAFVTANGLAP